MGLSGGSHSLFSLKNLSKADIGYICKGLAAEFASERPIIVVDVSNVIRVAAAKTRNKVLTLTSFLAKWADCGVDVVPDCDGDVCPVSKQATNDRRAKQDRSRVKAFVLKQELAHLRCQLRESRLTAEERTQLLNNIKSKERSMKTCESQSQSATLHSLAEELEHEVNCQGLHNTNDAGGKVCSVVKAEFEAGAYMMGRVVDNRSVVVMSEDSDILAVAGDCCVSIKTFTGKSYEIVCTSLATIEKVKTYLRQESSNKVQLTLAAAPVFNGVTSRKLRALMCLIVGCDVYLPGAKGVGMKKLLGVI